ncbi:DUF6314 family protein [uncultured Tateyamaria sp.]|uniref:DUF6314 family protein n=1 Tax=Tateyamaria sp. 1078 TaxID=3417464 RepID=UPI00260D4279|nr:DUF6314 family protein [uncultured Tateyamaria sp.]
MPTNRVLQDFVGVWQISRKIHHADGTCATFDGQAVFAPEADGLRHDETGTLRIGAGPPLSATQRYCWDADLAVYFEDGRFFHHVPPLGGDTAHWCDPDQYDGRYGFEDWPSFTVQWRVRGPRKDYRMLSRYDRAGSI